MEECQEIRGRCSTGYDMITVIRSCGNLHVRTAENRFAVEENGMKNYCNEDDVQ